MWKCFWAYATTIDFDEEFAEGQTLEEFVYSVNRILEIHKGKKVDKFRIFFNSGHQYWSGAEKWVQFATSKGVKELDINLSGKFIVWKELRKLPNCLFSCQSLTHLRLFQVDISLPLEFSGLRSLETLFLQWVGITDDMLESLLMNCPLLEKLSLLECSKLGSIKISSPPRPRLKSLSIVNCCDAYDIEIYSPNLQSFHFFGDLLYECSFRNISSLVDVLLSSSGVKHLQPEHDCIKILSDLAHVKILTVCAVRLLDLFIQEYNPEDLPITMNNLQELQLLVELVSDNNLTFIYNFLEDCICPCLEKLFITQYPYFPQRPYRSNPETIAEEPSEFVFHNLKTLKITNFTGHEIEMQFLKFILEKAVVLKHLVLVAPQKGIQERNKHSTTSQSESIKTTFNLLHEQLLLLPKESSDVRIVLCEYSKDDGSFFPTHTDPILFYVLDV